MAVEILTEPNFTPLNPKSLFAGSYVAGVPFGRNYDVVRDGRFLMLKTVPDAGPTQGNVIFNWTEQLKRLVAVEN